MEHIRHYTLAIFIALIIALTGMTVSVLNTGFRFNTNLIALLPETADNLITQQADQQLTESMGQRLLIVLSASNKQQLFEAGTKLQQLFCVADDNAPVTCINPASSGDTNNLMTLLAEHHHYLLNNQQVQRIKNQPEQLSQNALKHLYGISQWSPLLPITEDPLGLFDEYVHSLLTAMAPYKQFQGMHILSNSQGEETGLALFIKLKNDAYNLDYQKTFSLWFKQNAQQFNHAYPQVKLLSSGVIFHASNAADNARQEITFISIISMAGIILLFLACFRSLQPLLAGIASLGFACFCAIIVCQFFLQELHLITLVFGASLIGVSIDYALHFFCEKHFNGAANHSLKGQDAIRHIFPAISLGLITSLIGYGILTQAPMPGLKQIALFSITGLFAAWLFVIALFPLLQQKRRLSPPAILITTANACTYFWQKLGKRNSLIFSLLLFICSLLAINQLASSSNSIKTLYKPDAKLLAQEQEIHTLINGMANNQYFLVRGSSTDELLQLEQRLLAQLDTLISNGNLQGYIANRQFIADTATQQANYQLLTNAVYNNGGPAAEFFEQMGASHKPLTTLQQQMIDNKKLPISMNELHANLPSELQSLYLGIIDNQHVSLVLLRGIHSLESIEQLDLPSNIQFYNKVKAISYALKSQQTLALKQLVLGYILIGLIILLRYRHLPALGLIAIPLLSSLLSVAILCLLAIPISLFHVFALFLILGLGMDYAIFLYDAKQTVTSSQIAVFLSAATSCLSFGLLSLSSTPMIAAFGLTILLGSLINFALAPLVIYCKPQ